MDKDKLIAYADALQDFCKTRGGWCVYNQPSSWDYGGER